MNLPELKPLAPSFLNSLEEMISRTVAQGLGKNSPPSLFNTESLAGALDHTLLKAQSTRDEVLKICQEARTHGFASVCVNSSWISVVKKALEGSLVKPISVVGFPLGAMSTRSKVAETLDAIENGAQEIDMVLPVGKLKDRAYGDVYQDIFAVVQAAHPVPVKVILETCFLDQSQKIAACVIAREAKAHFVKTSTGFGSGGATIEDVRLMRSVVGAQMGVKASGGIKTREQAIALLQAGANRLGTSSSVDLVSGETRDKVTPSQDNY